MKYTYHYFKFLIVFLGIIMLSACSTTPKPVEPETIPVNLSIIASDNINPDFENRASPIVIRVYQLTHIDTFDNNDFFSLYENDQLVLAKDLLYREEIELIPGQKITDKVFDIKRNSKYIAVLAAYRDLDKSQWKSIIKINPDHELQPLTIELKKFEVLISIIKNEKAKENKE